MILITGATGRIGWPLIDTLTRTYGADVRAVTRDPGRAELPENVDDDPALQPSRFRGDCNKEAEAAVVSSGLEWVSLRPTSFSANAVLSWGAQIAAGDVVRAPFAAFEEAPVDPRDVADVAERAMAGRGMPEPFVTAPRTFDEWVADHAAPFELQGSHA